RTSASAFSTWGEVPPPDPLRILRTGCQAGSSRGGCDAACGGVSFCMVSSVRECLLVCVTGPMNGCAGGPLPGPRRLWLAVGQTPDPGRQQADLLGGQVLLLGRHLVVAAIQDGLDNGRLGAAVQPDIIGQVGSAQRLVALAVDAVAGHAVGLEPALAGIDPQRIVGQARQGTDILGDGR